MAAEPNLKDVSDCPLNACRAARRGRWYHVLRLASYNVRPCASPEFGRSQGQCKIIPQMLQPESAIQKVPPQCPAPQPKVKAPSQFFGQGRGFWCRCGCRGLVALAVEGKITIVTEAASFHAPWVLHPKHDVHDAARTWKCFMPRNVYKNPNTKRRNAAAQYCTI